MAERAVVDFQRGIKRWTSKGGVVITSLEIKHFCIKGLRPK